MTRFWSPVLAPAGRMPGVTTAISDPTMARTAAASQGEQTTPPMPMSRAWAARMRDQFGGCDFIAGPAQIGVVHRGQHGNTEQAEFAALRRVARRLPWRRDRRGPSACGRPA